jgi:MFS transporter, ACS family, tartrate transporter
LPAIILAVVTYFYLTPVPAQAKWLADDERQWLERTLADEDQKIHAETRQKFTLGTALLNWRVLVLGLLYIGMNMGLSGINNWMPTIIKSLGTMTNLEVASVTAIPWICGAFAAILWGRHSDRSNERYVNLAIPLFVGAAGFVASAYVGSPMLGIACLSVAVMGIIAGYTVFWVVPGTFLTGVAVAGGIALVNSMGNIGGFIAPFVIGWIRQATGSFTNALLVLAGAMVLSGVIALLIRPPRAAT